LGKGQLNVATLCVRIRVRETFQNLLRLERIGKAVEARIQPFQIVKCIEGISSLRGIAYESVGRVFQ
jgi:hypothetical protein